MNDDEWICNITPLLGPQVSYTCEQLVLHAMDYFGHCWFLPIALASESSDWCGSTQNIYGLVSPVWHIGALQCADCFHSQNRHTVPSWSDSWDPENLGMLAGVVVWLISAHDMANADKCCGRCRPVSQASDMGELWPTQARIFADTCQWYCWSCGWHRPVYLMTQDSDVADAGQYFFWHRPVILLELWPMQAIIFNVMWPTQARIFADTGQWYCWSCGRRRPLFLMWCGWCRPEFLLTQASIFNDRG